jgi:hypothetical protein
MRIINTRVHGVLDYLVALILIGAPWILGFTRNGAETWIPVALGVSAIIYSLFTNYELGAARVLSMKTHLGLDMASGLLLVFSPWIFGFNNYVLVPHLVLGLLELSVVLMTDPLPYRNTNTNASVRN